MEREQTAIPCAPEDGAHWFVLGEDARAKPADAVLSRRHRQRAYQERAETAALVVVDDRERHFGGVGSGPLSDVPRRCHTRLVNVVGRERHPREVIEVIDVDEVLDDLVTQGRGAEEAFVMRLAREPRLGVGELAAIGREDRSDPEPGAVPKRDADGAGVGGQSLPRGARDPLRDAGDVEQRRKCAGVAGVAREWAGRRDRGRPRRSAEDAELADDGA